jgi:hypothetical protein
VPQPGSFPFGSVALLNFYDGALPKPNFLGDATGFFVKPDLLLTAAHNLIYSRAKMVGVFPGWDSKLHVSHVVAGLRWCQSTTRDVSVMVTQPGAPMVVAMGGAPTLTPTLIGYASDYPDGSRRMSMGTGAAHVQGHEWTYEIAAQQRDSGAPVLSATNEVMALHKELLPGPGGTMIGGGEAVDADFIRIVADLEVQARLH